MFTRKPSNIPVRVLSSMFLIGLFLSFGAVICEAANDLEYVIGVEDVISVNVRDRSDLSGGFAVGPEGNITFPLLGDIKAAGVTVSQFSRELNRRLSVFHLGEAVVSVVQYNSLKVFVVGEVVKPGKYTFSVIPSVWHVLSEAGGPTEAALLSAVQIIRGQTGETVIVDVKRLLSGESQEQVKLLPGDTIRVPRRTGTAPEGDVIYVLGEVKLPGSYEISVARDVVAAVAAAGGPTERAELRKVTLVRRGTSSSTTFRLNFEKYLKEGQLSGNPELRNSDTLTIPAKKSGLSAFLSPTVIAAIFSAIASIVLIARA